MKVLVVGSGGREHAIVWKLSRSEKVKKIYCAPGNGGISDTAECTNIQVMDFDGIVKFSKTKDIDLVVVAPDDPLAAGLVDRLEAEGIKAFGPYKKAAELESSKVFSKNFMKKYGIPTAEYQVFTNSGKALEYLKNVSFPIVVKADGLALGKGVIIAQDYDSAEKAVLSIMENKDFGDAGNSIVIEEFLTGPEVSILAFVDGKTVLPMISSQDHKRAYDNDEGLNTGGMGTFSPGKIYTREMASICERTIFNPTIEALKKEGIKYKGVLYFGLILTRKGPYVLEYNARFGDPETQSVLPLLKNDLADVFMAVIEERLDEIKLDWLNKACVCVILASGGYPVKYQKGYEIEGLNDINSEDIILFHAGTYKKDDKFYTNGGRVLGVTALGEDMDNARKKAYEAVSRIRFKDMHYRTDIGIKK